MTTTRSGSKSPSPAKKNSKNSKKPPKNSYKVDLKMSLKRIAKKVMGDVSEPSATKKRPIPNKVESRKAKRAKPSKSTKDVISDSDFENEMHDGREKPKVKSKIVVAWKLLPGCFQIAANLPVLSCCHPNAHCSVPKFPDYRSPSLRFFSSERVGLLTECCF
ncbi:hypothetical protein CsatB_030626 [Cannabis sativa]